MLPSHSELACGNIYVEGQWCPAFENREGWGSPLCYSQSQPGKLGQPRGFFDVEVFVRAKNVAVQDILTKPGVFGKITSITQGGTISAVNVLTSGGWLRIIGAGTGVE